MDQSQGKYPSEDVIRVHDDPTKLDGAAWNALLACQAQPTPFMRWEYLAALHGSGSAVPSAGWAPRFVTVHRRDTLVAAAPAYLKAHSYGEYVFDWAWAEAYQRHGLRYYPKLLVAVPFTPVPGSRLLAVDEAARQALAKGVKKSGDAWQVIGRSEAGLENKAAAVAAYKEAAKYPETKKWAESVLRQASGK